MAVKHILVALTLFGSIGGCAPQPGQPQTAASSMMYDNEGQDFGTAPTNAIRTTGFEAPTPLTIIGATTVSTSQLQSMLASPRPPILIDVLGGDQTESLPGAIWLRGAGLGNSMDDITQRRLGPALAQFTKGDKSAPIAFFCLSKTCWLSHNTAVRAVALGYTNVLWYRGGRNAWKAAGLPLQPVKPTDM